MNFWPTRLVVFLLLLISVTPCSPCIAQEHVDLDLEHLEFGKFEFGKSEPEKAFEKRMTEVILGRAALLPSDLNLRHEERMAALREHPNVPPATFVIFGSRSSPYRPIVFKNSYWPSLLRANNLRQPGIQDYYTLGDVFLLMGDVTSDDEEWFRSKAFPYVICSKLTPKNSFAEYLDAAAIAVKPLKASSAVILNALPYESGTVRSQLELKRMGLSSTPSQWHSARQKIISAVGDIPIVTANKRTVLSELQGGKSDVLFVIAHSDSKSIFLPGLNGGRISIQELQGIKRDVAPMRAVVLLTCKSGSVNGNTESIAEVLVKNRLATVVFATDKNIYATELAEMLRGLQYGGSLHSAFHTLRPIAQLEPFDIERF